MTFSPPAVSDELPTSTSPPLLLETTDSKIVFRKDRINALYGFLGVWVQRQCVCLFREQRNVERFCVLVQQLTRFCVQQLKNLRSVLEAAQRGEPGEGDDEVWTVKETENFLQFMAKVFMLQFPLYAGPKQVRWSHL